jgi:hypothetical protein
MEVELTMVPFYVDGDGTEIVTWAFQPVRTGDEGVSR